MWWTAANMRRGFFSINALWKNKIAVLVGDYLLSRGLLLADRQGRVRAAAHREHRRARDERRRTAAAGKDAAASTSARRSTSTSSARRPPASSPPAAPAVPVPQGAPPRRWTACATSASSPASPSRSRTTCSTTATARTSASPAGLDIKEKKLTLPLIHALQQRERQRPPLDGERREEPERGQTRPWPA